MAVTYEHARQFLGRPVCAHCRGGKKYYGIVQNVTRRGVWLQPFRHGSLAIGKKSADVTTADRPGQIAAENVFLPFILPFVTLFALSPWYGYGWRGARPYGYGMPYGGYGGNGYGVPGPYGAYGYPGARPGFWF